MKEKVKEYILLVLGNFIFAMGAVMLVEPYGFAPGGTYGLSMVFHHLWGWRTEAVALCLDIPLLIIGILVLGPKFGFKTFLSTFILPASMWFFHTIYGYDSIIEPGIHDIALFQDQILAAIFGGIIYGIGLGLVFRSRATTGGSDIIAMILRKYTHISMGTATVIVDGIITLSSVIAFGDWRLPMYSWIIIFVCSKVIDLILEGEPTKTMMIISDKIEPIREYIIQDMDRGGTIVKGTGMYQGAERNIIYVVLSRREMVSLRVKVAEIDPRAFINILDSSEIIGEGFKSIKDEGI
ncbi:MAG: YitT family protein [Bacteroidales bacterium]|nr:YitT family protein [Bacteroidales bacterium]